MRNFAPCENFPLYGNSVKLQNDDMKLAKTFFSSLVLLLFSFSFLVDQGQSLNDLLQTRIPSQLYNLF